MPAVDHRLPWHHAHVTVSDREAAAHWYETHLGAERKPPTPRSENLMYGPNLVQFQGKSVAGPLTGSRLQSLGFAAPDVDRLVRDLPDVTVTACAHGYLATDPFGVQLELIEGGAVAQTHLNIETTMPDELALWYRDHLGGAECACAFDVQRRGLAWDSYRLYFGHLTSAVAGTASDNRSIDHIGWYTTDLDATWTKLAAAGVDFAVPPRAFGSVRLAFARDPTGIWIELVEPPHGKVVKP